MVKPNGSYDLSILKSLDGDPACACRYFYEYDAPKTGAVSHTNLTLPTIRLV